MDKAVDYSRVIVAWRNGSPVKLDEVAKIYDSVENHKIATWLNDERAIVLAIQKQPDANTVAVVDSVRAKLPALQRANSAVGFDQRDDGPLDLHSSGGGRR